MRDHVRVTHTECACGRTGFGIRIIGRTDDLLIVRGHVLTMNERREVIREGAQADIDDARRAAGLDHLVVAGVVQAVRCHHRLHMEEGALGHVEDADGGAAQVEDPQAREDLERWFAGRRSVSRFRHQRHLYDGAGHLHRPRDAVMRHRFCSVDRNSGRRAGSPAPPPATGRNNKVTGAALNTAGH